MYVAFAISNMRYIIIYVSVTTTLSDNGPVADQGQNENDEIKEKESFRIQNQMPGKTESSKNQTGNIITPTVHWVCYVYM